MIENKLREAANGYYNVPNQAEAVKAISVVHVHGRLPDPGGSFSPAWIRDAANHIKVIHDELDRKVVAEARDGEEAVELALAESPDLALLDVKMPKLDGIDAARRILEERPMPIVMVTAYGEKELVARAVEAGVFGYLVKPFRETDLLPAIEMAQARHEELVALRAEADSLAAALAARKAIERAKGLLMEREGLSERDAFARLRKASQISGRKLEVVAEALIATLDAPAARAD